ncbi:Glycosyltransferase involved in cell wall bisynthesis [Marinobacter gudaonensis]|uniref:Glycosyltransferase involved in cell wall bisynthesis n=1 Tax=Marinobacter gudaonensis TaxID=375760 RepID=A0A1I6GJI4_9GAMM|nr:glycosyltransferase family 4 protein [Marinobacter gudaonensis]SFR42309.1 Glycosyltransferase involved in cell wall bisynthesis [Marinobacter gudaonensis]
MNRPVGVWFPTIRAGTGVDRFTVSLVERLRSLGVRAEITWLPPHAEYLPWTVEAPAPPEWATVTHINSWLHKRFYDTSLPTLVTLHSCVHDSNLMPYKSVAQRAYHRLWVFQREKQAIQRASKITAVSAYTANSARTCFGSTKIEVIPNWVDTDRFFPSDDAFKRRPFRLLFVGNLSRRKGADLLPHIMRRLGAGFELRYTGTPDWFHVKDDIPENMIALGYINNEEEVAALYRNSDALLFPSRLEGLPLSVLEAMASGLPVVCSNSSSLPEVVVQDVTGELCRQDEIQDFVSAVMKLADTPNLHSEMSKAAASRARTLFNAKVVVGKYLEIYRELTMGRA